MKNYQAPWVEFGGLTEKDYKLEATSQIGSKVEKCGPASALAGQGK